VIYSLGFFSAIPVGPTQIEIAKRSLHNHLRAAVMVVLGSFFSDFMYGVIALFGVAPFFSNQKAVAIFELCGAIILWILAFLTLKESAKAHLLEIAPSFLKSRRISFITGFSLSVVNPMMIFWWLVGVQIVRHLDLVDTFTSALSLAFVLCGALGLTTYLTALAVALHWAKKFFSNKAMKKIHVALGLVLILISLYFLVNSLRILIG
jgi:threonine/homoserine/homoserine lactone efflux protein